MVAVLESVSIFFNYNSDIKSFICFLNHFTIDNFINSKLILLPTNYAMLKLGTFLFPQTPCQWKQSHPHRVNGNRMR